MTADVDVLVVGGGPVGLGAGLMAARAGLSVTVMESRPQPVDKACGEGLMPGALHRLAGLGVDPPGMPFYGIAYLEADGRRRAEARFPSRHGRPGVGRGVRRTTLSTALLEAGTAAGVKLVPHAVAELQQQPDLVTVRTATERLTARYVLAADGLHSRIRRGLGMDVPATGPARYGQRGHFAVQPWTDLVEVHWAQDGEAYVTPVAPDLVGVAVLTSRRGPSLSEWLTRFPALREHLGGREPVGRVLGAGPLRQTASSPRCGRVLLIGDAAGYVDALTGEGIAVGLAGAAEAVRCVVADRPEAYPRRWAAASRRYRAITRAVLAASSTPATRARLVPAAAALPPLFRGAVALLS